MKVRNILLLGGSGFVGCHVAARLAARGARVIVPTRRRERARHLCVLPTVEVRETDVHDDTTLAGLVAGQDAVVNLVGILHSRNGRPYGPDFARAHVDLPRRLAAACRAAGVRRVVHVSALNADSHGPSQYLRSKGDGEAALREADAALDLTILRPSVIFGPGDAFLNLFAALQRRVPLVLVGRPGARFQPVFVGDVAATIIDCLERDKSIGQTCCLCGPTVYTLAELVRLAGHAGGCARPVIGLPLSLARLQARLLECLPNPSLSVDNLDSMAADSVCDGAPLPFDRQPAALEAVAPQYLAANAPHRRFDAFRLRARR